MTAAKKEEYNSYNFMHLATAFLLGLIIAGCVWVVLASQLAECQEAKDIGKWTNTSCDRTLGGGCNSINPNCSKFSGWSCGAETTFSGIVEVCERICLDNQQPQPEEEKCSIRDTVTGQCVKEQERQSELIREMAIKDGLSEKVECNILKDRGEYGLVWYCIDANKAEQQPRECVMPESLCLYSAPNPHGAEYVDIKDWHYSAIGCEDEYIVWHLEEEVITGCDCWSDEPCAEGNFQ